MPYEKVGKNEPVCIADEVPFDIPNSWEWARLKDLTIKEIKRGKSPKYADDGNVYVFAQKCNVKLGGIDISLAKFLDMKTFDKYPVEEYMADGDIIINSTGNGTLGRIGIFRDSDRINDFVIVPDSHVTIIRAGNQMIKDYLFFALKYHQPYLEKLGEGSTNQTELRPSTVAELFIPVPPIGEQERIVAKLQEVLPMADVYGLKEKSLQDYNKDFPAQLKKSILQEAVQGKLVPQDPDDEPVSVLLERIRAEKEQLIKAGKIKRDKHESVIFRRDNSHYEKRGSKEVCIYNEIPFDIPNSWEWARLKDIVIKDIKRGKSPKYSELSNVYVFAQKCNTKQGKIDISLSKYLKTDTFEKYPETEYMLDEDIVINSTGNGTLGRIGIFHDSDRIDDNIIVPDSHVTVIRSTNLISKEYLFYVLKYYQPYLEKLGEGSTNQTELKPATIAELFIPVPPVQEQHRMVSAIMQLLLKLSTL